MTLFKSAIAQRRWSNFQANRRAYWSFWIFSVLFLVCLAAEFIANDKPILISYQGELRMPVFKFYSEADFGGEFETEAIYSSAEVRCLIKTGGYEECVYEPNDILQAFEEGALEGVEVTPGWALWPPIPYSYNTINYNVATAPSAPDQFHMFGTDEQTRSVIARMIYGFRISTLFALVVVVISSSIGIVAGALMGFYGGWIDLFFQRVVEIWNALPTLYMLIIIGAIFTIDFWLLAFLIALFSWTGLVGVVRAEFLRARNFEYVRAARALGVSDWKIMRRHVLPNAMVGTLTSLPFIITGAIGALTSLDFLGFGLPPSYPSLGELALQAKQNLQAPWLGWAAFFSITVMLSLLVFIFEGVRDAFDPKKTFQ